MATPAHGKPAFGQLIGQPSAQHGQGSPCPLQPEAAQAILREAHDKSGLWTAQHMAPRASGTLWTLET